MRRKRHRVRLDLTLITIMTLFVLGGMSALGFLQNVSKENRALMILVNSVGIIACFAGSIYLNSFRKWYRRSIWLKAMSAWKESSEAGNTRNFEVAPILSMDGLKHLAIRTYSHMGYRIADRERGAGSLQLMNPDGMLELVACEPQREPVELYRVYTLHLEMKRTKAVRGFFWAPGGFTSEAVIKGSRFLE